MADLKLSKLPERAPVRLTISLSPELGRALEDYAAAYEAAYQSRESVAELIPFILSQFLESDRVFAKRQKEKGK